MSILFGDGKAIVFVMLGFACTVGITSFLLSIADKKEKKNRLYSFREIDHMDGLAFEHCIATILRQNKYTKITVTRASGDFGVDIIAEKEEKRWVFQCKRYEARKLGIKPIQEIYAGAAQYRADVAVVVTNSYFSKNAKTLANNLGVRLWDRSTLEAALDGRGLPKD